MKTLREPDNMDVSVVGRQERTISTARKFGGILTSQGRGEVAATSRDCGTIRLVSTMVNSGSSGLMNDAGTSFPRRQE